MSVSGKVAPCSTSKKVFYRPFLSPISSCPSTPGTSFHEPDTVPAPLPLIVVTIDAAGEVHDRDRDPAAAGARTADRGGGGGVADPHLGPQRALLHSPGGNSNLGKNTLVAGPSSDPATGASDSPATRATAPIGPYSKGMYGHNVPQATNGYTFTKSDIDIRDAVRKSSSEKSSPTPSPSRLDRGGKEGALRSEALRQAVRERASAGMSIEFTLTDIPEEVFNMAGERVGIIASASHSHYCRYFDFHAYVSPLQG